MYALQNNHSPRHLNNKFLAAVRQNNCQLSTFSHGYLFEIFVILALQIMIIAQPSGKYEAWSSAS